MRLDRFNDTTSPASTIWRSVIGRSCATDSRSDSMTRATSSSVTAAAGFRASKPVRSSSTIVRPDVDRRRVAQRLAGREHVGVDLGRPHDRELVLVHGVMERLLDQAAEHLAAHLIAEHALEHLTGRLPRSESRETCLAADEREGAIDLGLDGRSTDLDLQALAARPEFLERDLGSIHRGSIALSGALRAMREGGLEPPRLPARS